MNSVRDDARVRTVLDRLHAESEAQEVANAGYLAGHGARTTVGDDADREAGRSFWRDKYVALDRPKAELCYSLCRVRNARRVLEAGTSFGVSTLYLAAGVRDNGGGIVIATELEPAKADKARSHFEEAGVADLVDLRLGDIRDTVRATDGPIDVLLLDIWVPLVRPVLDQIAPSMPVGSIVIADNTQARRAAYQPLFDFVDDAANGFTTTTLPYSGGLELAVKTG